VTSSFAWWNLPSPPSGLIPLSPFFYSEPFHALKPLTLAGCFLVAFDGWHFLRRTLVMSHTHEINNLQNILKKEILTARKTFLLHN